MKLRPTTALLLVFVFAFLFVYTAVTARVEFVRAGPEYLQISDYAYHVLLTQAFWFDGFGNVYDHVFQLGVLSEYTGLAATKVMPLGITPSALVVWLPFSGISLYSLGLSYTVWAAFSLTVLVGAIFLNVSSCRRSMLLYAYILATCVSATLFNVLALGQTTALAVAALLLLYYQAKNKKPLGNGLLILLTLAVAIKPPYLLLGLFILWAFGRFREVLIMLLSVCVLFLALTPALGVTWSATYSAVLSMYAAGVMPEFYAWSINTEKMNVFRYTLGAALFGSQSGVISNSLFYLSGALCALASVFPLSRSRLSNEQLIVLAFSAYLLFAPYLGGYEELLLTVPVVMVATLRGKERLTRPLHLLTILCLLGLLSRTLLPGPIGFYFLLKCVVLVLLLILAQDENLPLGKNSKVSAPKT